MTNNTALETATAEYVAANDAWTDYLRAHQGEPLALDAAEDLIQRERTARENYARELSAAGYAVPAGLLNY